MTQISEHLEKIKTEFAKLPKGHFFSQKLRKGFWRTVVITDKSEVVEIVRHSDKFWPTMEILLNNIPWFFRIIDDFPKMEQRVDELRTRVTLLESSIKEHQGRTTTFRPSEINPIDQELWSLVPATPNDHIRGKSNETKTVRVSANDLSADDLSATSWCSKSTTLPKEDGQGDQAHGATSDQINDGCM